MNKLTILVAAIVVASTVSVQNAFAIKPFADAFADKYELTEPKTESQKKLAAAVKEVKCGMCHGPKSKKERNDYGEALDKLLDKADYSTKRRKAEPEAVEKELFAALDKVAKEKSKKGGTYGELIEEGKLPGVVIEKE